jgi:outer membrane protein assembly factor BamB
MNAVRRSLLLILPFAGLVTAQAAGDWDQWRGPQRDGTVSDAAVWPQKLDDTALVRRWHVPLGPSYSGPLITADRVYVTDAKDQAYEAAIALDRATGKEVWRHQWEGYVKVPFFAKSNGDWIRSTPALADGRLYVGGMRDVLVCLEAASGKELWKFDFPRELKKAVPDFGFVCSPLVVGGAVYVQAGAGLARLDAATGRLAWRTLDDGGGMWGSAFSSPVWARFAGEEQVVVQTRDKLAGVRPADGKVLWEQSIKAFRGMNILTPVVTGDRILTAAYGGQTQGWTVSRDGDAWRIREDWHLKAEGYMSTPVVIDGHAYLHTRAQRLVCIDLATGFKRWETDEKFGKYLSLVAQDRRILALDQRGLLYLLNANPAKFEPAGQRRLTDGETWAHLAVTGADLAVRELGGVSLWSWQAPQHAGLHPVERR